MISITFRYHELKTYFKANPNIPFSSIATQYLSKVGLQSASFFVGAQKLTHNLSLTQSGVFNDAVIEVRDAVIMNTTNNFEITVRIYGPGGDDFGTRYYSVRKSVTCDKLVKNIRCDIGLAGTIHILYSNGGNVLAPEYLIDRAGVLVALYV